MKKQRTISTKIPLSKDSLKLSMSHVRTETEGKKYQESACTFNLHFGRCERKKRIMTDSDIQIFAFNSFNVSWHAVDTAENPARFLPFNTKAYNTVSSPREMSMHRKIHDILLGRCSVNWRLIMILQVSWWRSRRLHRLDLYTCGSWHRSHAECGRFTHTIQRLQSKP